MAVMIISFISFVFVGVLAIIVVIVSTSVLMWAVGRWAGGSAAASTREWLETIRVVRAQPWPTILDSSLSYGVVGQPYKSTISALGQGVRPWTWSILEGSFPPGLVLRQLPPAPPSEAASLTHDDRGEISGVPALPGIYAFTMEVRDSANPPRASREDSSITVYESEYHRQHRMQPPVRYNPMRYRL